MQYELAAVPKKRIEASQPNDTSVGFSLEKEEELYN